LHLGITKVYYSPTNARVIVLKNNIKIYIHIAPTCFGKVTPPSRTSVDVQGALFVSRRNWGMRNWLCDVVSQLV